MLPNCRELKLADTSTKLMIIGRPTDDYWVTAQWTIVEAVTELFLSLLKGETSFPERMTIGLSSRS